MKDSSDSKKKHRVVLMQLSIVQCELLERLVDLELSEVEVTGSTTQQNVLKRILDIFWEVTKPSEAEKKAKFEAWVRTFHSKGIDHVR